MACRAINMAAMMMLAIAQAPETIEATSWKVKLPTIGTIAGPEVSLTGQTFLSSLESLSSLSFLATSV
jgi:hypothetical protein